VSHTWNHCLPLSMYYAETISLRSRFCPRFLKRSNLSHFPRVAHRDGTHPSCGVSTSVMAFLLSEGRGSPDPWREQGTGRERSARRRRILVRNLWALPDQEMRWTSPSGSRGAARSVCPASPAEEDWPLIDLLHAPRSSPRDLGAGLAARETERIFVPPMQLSDGSSTSFHPAFGSQYLVTPTVGLVYNVL
jgi:hypothetical protein